MPGVLHHHYLVRRTARAEARFYLVSPPLFSLLSPVQLHCYGLGCAMLLSGKKLGLLLSTGPEHPAFRHGLKLAEAALRRGIQVYLYCIDDAVNGLGDAQLQALKAGGANLFACAYGAQRR